MEGCVVLAMELGLLFSENECSTCHQNMGRVRKLRKKMMVLGGVVEGVGSLFLLKRDYGLQIQN